MPDSLRNSRPLDDYPLSLQMAARALWGDDFWGAHKPLPVATATAREKTGAGQDQSR